MQTRCIISMRSVPRAGIPNSRAPNSVTSTHGRIRLDRGGEAASQWGDGCRMPKGAKAQTLRKSCAAIYWHWSERGLVFRSDKSPFLVSELKQGDVYFLGYVYIGYIKCFEPEAPRDTEAPQ